MNEVLSIDSSSQKGLSMSRELKFFGSNREPVINRDDITYLKSRAKFLINDCHQIVQG